MSLRRTRPDMEQFAYGLSASARPSSLWWRRWLRDGGVGGRKRKVALH